MIIDLQSNDIINAIRALLSDYKILSKNDIYGLFPKTSTEDIDKILNSLASSSIKKKVIETEEYFCMYNSKKFTYKDYISYCKSRATLIFLVTLLITSILFTNFCIV